MDDERHSNQQRCYGKWLLPVVMLADHSMILCLMAASEEHGNQTRT